MALGLKRFTFTAVNLNKALTGYDSERREIRREWPSEPRNLFRVKWVEVRQDFFTETENSHRFIESHYKTNGKQSG